MLVSPRDRKNIHLMKSWTILFSCRLDRVHQKVLQELLTLILICLQSLLQTLFKLDKMEHLLLVSLVEVFDLKMNLGNKKETKYITETNRLCYFPLSDCTKNNLNLVHKDMLNSILI